ncbi:FAD-dependent oxidoreductase [Pseudolabrys taiwanensis]|uniref:FAD-dependent oxidoreductase n=1 Tax=Pseudolabrys taiwanensis TaxID=331696 RepID=A0A345ZXA6_9HYPH|nr:FAD/NAD(P)-binding protein [Pseudolabrys taiwanensis]AXK81553.1 FAD-dependent oxidoreductase [Pseudolabrys taiwanensis]
MRRAQQHAVIVGGGASGVLLAVHLLKKSSSPLNVTLIEKRPSVGRGVAYSTSNPDHLLNVRAHNMSAFPDEPNHFSQWIAARRTRSSNDTPSALESSSFVPRGLYGDYVAGLIEPYIGAGANGRSLEVMTGECISLAENAGGVSARLSDGRSLEADLAILATGHPETEIGARCFADPWTPPAEAGIKPDDTVFILGTGLTMVDYVMALQLAGHRGPIIAMSRRGLLPKPHRPVKPFPLGPADIPTGASAAELARWLHICARTHIGRGGDWRSVVDGLRPYTQSLWQAFSAADRRRFLEHARAWWDVHRHRMAPAAELRIKAAVDAGQLTIVAAKTCGIDLSGEGAVVHFRRRGVTTLESVWVSKIVECKSSSDLAPKNTSPLLHGMLADGTVRPDALGIGLDVTDDCAVRSRSGTVSERIYAVGPLTRAAFWEITAIPDIRTQCAKLAATLIDRLSVDWHRFAKPPSAEDKTRAPDP